MRIIGQGLVYDARTAPRHRAFCSFTECAVLRDGGLLVAFRAGSSKDAADENILIFASDDQGESWRQVFAGLEPRLDGVMGGWRGGSITELAPDCLLGFFDWFDRSDPTRPLSNPATQGTLPSRLFLMVSSDRAATWAEAREIDTRPYAGIAATGAPMRMANGDLAVPYETWKGYDDPSPGEHHALLHISHNGGYSFDQQTIVAHDPQGQVLYWDQRLAVDPQSGQVVGLFWTHDRRAEQDRNIHIAWGSPDGREWSPVVDTGIAGQIAAPLPLPDGRLLMAYVHRHYPPTLRAVISPDFGRTWDTDNELVFYESGSGQESGMAGKRDFGDYWSDMRVWSFGHPSARLLPDGTVFITYYGGDSSSLSVHWVRLAL